MSEEPGRSRAEELLSRLYSAGVEPEAVLQEAIAIARQCVASGFEGLSAEEIHTIGAGLGVECGMVLDEVDPGAEIVARWLAGMFEFWDANTSGNEVAFWLSVGDQLEGDYHRALVKRWLPFLRDQAAESSRRARQVITCLQYVQSYDGRWFLNDIRLSHPDPEVREYADYAMKHRWLR